MKPSARQSSASDALAALYASNPMLSAFDHARLRSYLNGVTDPAGAVTAAQSTPGFVEQGNIDLTDRPALRNPDGSVSTTYSMSFEDEDGNQVVIPGIADDGSRLLSTQQAIDQYHRTGKHFGKFKTPEAADAFANALHQIQAGRIDQSYLNPSQ